jgi:hypothetical protein
LFTSVPLELIRDAQSPSLFQTAPYVRPQ